MGNQFARVIFFTSLVFFHGQAMGTPLFPVAAVLQERLEATPANVSGVAWLDDYQQAMNDARAGYAYALRRQLVNLQTRLAGLASGAPGGNGRGGWIAAECADELVALEAPDLNLREDIRRGHINPQPRRPTLVAGAIAVTWLPRQTLEHALRKAESAVAEHAPGASVSQDLRDGLAQVRQESYLRDTGLLRAYGLLEAAQATSALGNGVSSTLLLQGADELKRDASPPGVAVSLRRLAGQGQPAGYAIGALADRLKSQIAERARRWFARSLPRTRYSLSLKGISASSS